MKGKLGQLGYNYNRLKKRNLSASLQNTLEETLGV